MLDCEDEIHSRVRLINSHHVLKWICEDIAEKSKVALESMQEVHDRVSFAIYLLRLGNSLSWGAHLISCLLICRIVELVSLREQSGARLRNILDRLQGYLSICLPVAVYRLDNAGIKNTFFSRLRGESVVSLLASELAVAIGNQDNQEFVLEVIPPQSLAHFLIKLELIIVDVNEALADTSDRAGEKLPILIVHGNTNRKFDSLIPISGFESPQNTFRPDLLGSMIPTDACKTEIFIRETPTIAPPSFLELWIIMQPECLEVTLIIFAESLLRDVLVFIEYINIDLFFKLFHKESLALGVDHKGLRGSIIIVEQFILFSSIDTSLLILFID